ncbi:hypothetical protein [Azohydromonas caseinilytica]|uniref:Uncharacterized protein n=1 Tax=Azohydromonas caseinilytica TaxID=2728836 RepID=A0A848FC62_9BURK|nr:hypothetical protein [Azohydromonas caseinilytica]NML15551.1 hypothetical protein [Azohydromonas caseinilytica]
MKRNNKVTPHPDRNAARVKAWGYLIGSVAAVVAVVPPVISALKPAPAETGRGGGISMGNVTSSGNTTINNMVNYYVEHWDRGFRILKNDKAAIASEPSAPVSSCSGGPESRALGILAKNISLLNNSSWKPPPSCLARDLTFRVNLQGKRGVDKPGMARAIIYRNEEQLCSISLRLGANSVKGSGRENAICSDFLAPNSTFTYRAEVSASEMTVLALGFSEVRAVKR